jgi:predicted amidohydrolase
MTFVDRIAAAQTRWDAAVVLLEAWNARPEGVGPIRDQDEFLGWVDEVREHFEGRPGELELDNADRAEILRWTEAGEDPHRVDAVGFGLNLSSSAGFAQCWRERRAGKPYRPEVGDVYPCPAAPWPRELGGARRTPSPLSMNIPDDDDHPHARVFRADSLPVEFRFDLWRPLSRIGATLDRVAAVTVDEGLAELGLDVPRPVAFPVAPVDPEERERRVLDQLDRAGEHGARIVVLPELATTRAIADRVAERLADDEEQRLVVCGSWHETVDGAPANVSVGLVSGLKAEMEHRKLVEFGDLFPRDPDHRRREGVVAPDPPLLRVHVAGAFRFAVVICKDFLDERVTRTLDRVGANVLLVPALSRTTQPFVARAHAHVADAQALSVVANGPRVWEDGRAIGRTAVLARPYEPRDVVAGNATPAPSLVVFSVRQGRVVLV